MLNLLGIFNKYPCACGPTVNEDAYDQPSGEIIFVQSLGLRTDQDEELLHRILGAAGDGQLSTSSEVWTRSSNSSTPQKPAVSSGGSPGQCPPAPRGARVGKLVMSSRLDDITNYLGPPEPEETPHPTGGTAATSQAPKGGGWQWPAGALKSLKAPDADQTKVWSTLALERSHRASVRYRQGSSSDLQGDDLQERSLARSTYGGPSDNRRHGSKSREVLIDPVPEAEEAKSSLQRRRVVSNMAVDTAVKAVAAAASNKVRDSTLSDESLHNLKGKDGGFDGTESTASTSTLLLSNGNLSVISPASSFPSPGTGSYSVTSVGEWDSLEMRLQEMASSPMYFAEAAKKRGRQRRQPPPLAAGAPFS